MATGFDGERSCPSPALRPLPRRPDVLDPVAIAFGQAICDARKRRGESLEDVAGRIVTNGRGGKASTMDPRYLGEIESGYHAPTIVRAVEIARSLEVELEDLVRGLK